MRRLATAVCYLVLLVSGGASPASAAETTTYGPLSPTNAPTSTLSGSVTVEGETLELVMTLTRPPAGEDHCFTAERRWTGVSYPAEPASTCGNAGGDVTVTATMPELPDTVDVRVCSGERATFDESTCSPWTRVFTGASPSPPEAAIKKWGPVRAERGLGVAKGTLKGDQITAELADRTRQRSRCAWTILTVAVGDEKHKSRLRACNGRKSMVRSYAGFTEAKVKVCSGTRMRPDKRTCRARQL